MVVFYFFMEIIVLNINQISKGCKGGVVECCVLWCLTLAPMSCKAEEHEGEQVFHILSNAVL